MLFQSARYSKELHNIHDTFVHMMLIQNRYMASDMRDKPQPENREYSFIFFEIMLWNILHSSDPRFKQLIRKKAPPTVQQGLHK